MVVRARTCTCPRRCTRPRSARGALPRFADCVRRRSTARRRTSTLVLAARGARSACWWFLFRTRIGYELRAVGPAARRGGVRRRRACPRRAMRAMALSGALAGLGGINFVLGYKHYYEEGFAGGAGFLGIAVALVGRNHRLGVVLAALFFATLSQGGARGQRAGAQGAGRRAAGDRHPRRRGVGARGARARIVVAARRSARAMIIARLPRCRPCASRCRTCSRRAAA